MQNRFFSFVRGALLLMSSMRLINNLVFQEASDSFFGGNDGK